MEVPVEVWLRVLDGDEVDDALAVTVTEAVPVCEGLVLTDWLGETVCVADCDCVPVAEAVWEALGAQVC